MSLSRISMALGLTAAAAALVLRPATAQSPGNPELPSDPQPTCTFTPSAFAAMFAGGTVTLNGAVNPANSTVNPGANTDNPCPFFQWADQMYLWMTAPTGAPGPGGVAMPTMFGPGFYTVSEEDANGRRSFVANTPGKPLRMRLRIPKRDEDDAAPTARSGQAIKVVPAAGGAAAATVRLRSGGTARLASVRRTRTGALQYLDARGRPLSVATAPASAAGKGAIEARRIVLGGTPVFIDRNNNVVELAPGTGVEEGQADANGGVLISQQNALVYYIISVNDVYANHRSMQPAGPINDPTTITFPQSAADAAKIVAFAKKNGRTINDPNALALETKSSWVDAASLPNPQDYVLVRATVPTFDKSNPTSWVQNGETTLTLAMVGLHVVGSTAGHGEMLWASYEHFGNAPNALFAYNSLSGLKTVPQNTAGSWQFAPNGFAGPFNNYNAQWTPAGFNPTTPSSIAGYPAGTAIGPNAVLRMAPWGSPQLDGSQPLNSPYNANILMLNTQLISLNNSRIGLLAAGDVRRNYFQLGTLWTNGGKAPIQPGGGVAGNLRGTPQLANATMETFAQGPLSSTDTGGTNCFSCHSSDPGTPPSTVPVVTISHVYGDLLPLP